MDHEVSLQTQEDELHKLRSEFADVPLIRTVLAIDLAIRRAAWRALEPQLPKSEGLSISRSTPGSSTS